MTRAPSLVALSVLAAACAAAGVIPPPDPGRAPAELSGADVTAIARILQLEDRRVYDPAVFGELADDATVEVRRRAAQGAGRIGDTAAVPMLARLLGSDPSPAVRADAAFALGELGHAGPVALDALERAAPAAWIPRRDEEVAVTVEIIAALGKIGGERARRLVRGALRNVRPAGNDRLRQVAAEGLLTVWKFDDGERNVLSAAPYLASETAGLRWRAAYALMRGGEASALPRLLALDEDPEHRVRAYAARALTAANADSAGVSDQALEWLTRALEDDHPHVRINAVRALAGYGDRAPIEAMATLLHDDDRPTGFAAAGALGSVGERAGSLLTPALAGPDLPLALRGEILAQLATAAPTRGGEAVERWAEGTPGQRYFAARALPALPPDRALPVALRLVDDSDPHTAVTAVGVLPALIGEGEDPDRRRAVRDALLSSADSPDPALRATALGPLRPHATLDDLDAVVTAFRRSAEEATTDPVARGAALAALAVLGHLQGRPDTVGEADRATVADRLFALPAPEDRWIRRAAAALGQGWGEPPEAVLAEELAVYEDVVRRYVAPPLAGEDRPRARIETPHGTVLIELLSEEAPLTVHNFVLLAEAGFFDGGVWHRVIPNFVLQDGAPGGAPTAGPGWTIRDEINRVRYGRGTIGMALSGPDTGGSQWFITHSPQPHLDGGYTVFGRVIRGMDAADAVLQGEAIRSIRIVP